MPRPPAAAKSATTAPAAEAGAAARVQQAYEGLTASARRLADYVLVHRFEAATLAIDALARKARVSVASANRFARALGYPGYAAMRAHWQRELHPGASALDKLRLQQQGQDGASAHHLMQQALADAAAALAQSAADLDPARCERFAQAVLNGRRVALFADDVSAYLAGYAYGVLSYFRAGVDLLALGGGSHEVFRRLDGYGPEDVLWLLSLPRYSRITVELAAAARARGVQVLALTDGPAAPVAALTTEALYAHAGQPVLPVSSVATLAFVEAVCTVVAQRSPQAIERLRQLSRRMQPLFVDAPRPDAPRPS